ncbi:hypothetical protein QCA50_012315 [Cerrena zonata]|uniref:Uncharacterized protein n=1 Tax=Cerrena zonata TaxID=2478898 RepID=A0AAW0FRU6_9APHY
MIKSWCSPEQSCGAGRQDCVADGWRTFNISIYESRRSQTSGEPSRLPALYLERCKLGTTTECRLGRVSELENEIIQVDATGAQVSSRVRVRVWLAYLSITAVDLVFCHSILATLLYKKNVFASSLRIRTIDEGRGKFLLAIRTAMLACTR